MTAIRVGLFGAVLLAAWGSVGVASPEPEPACRASLRVEPGSAFVEQPVQWQLRIESHPDVDRIEWVKAPAFPGTRAERVTILPETRLDSGWSLRLEERVIFPERPGALELPASTLACATGAGEDTWREVRIAPRRLEVQPLPTEGRPSDFTGLVGPVTLRRYLRPERVALGGTARVTVSVRGEGNVWAAADPHRGLALDDADVFPLPGETGIERGGGLRVTRIFEADLVPRRPGALLLPALRVSWFDPATRRYATETAAAIDLNVVERPGGPVAARAPLLSPDQAREDGAVRSMFPAAGLWIALRAAVVIALLGGVAWSLRRRVGRPKRAGAHIQTSAPDAAAEAERTLRAALTDGVPELDRHAPSALVERDGLSPAQRTALRLLVRLERARFDRNVEPPPSTEITRALASLRDDSA